jgi:pimeloyl-ACP methyl ester carboxylesterase
VLVKAANWLTHLDYDWDSPVWRHWIRFFSAHFGFIRYDERGCGMTDWKVGDLSFDRWVADLEAVADAAGTRQFVLLGISQGAATCVAYAAKHPERVARLVLYGGYVRGAAVRGTSQEAREFRAIVELARLGWGEHAASEICSRRGSYRTQARSRSTGSVSCAARRRHRRSPATCSKDAAALMSRASSIR